MLLALLVAGILFLLAAIHLYWGSGGRWPGHDEASMVEHVVGRTRGMKAPGLLASAAVALALATGGGLVLATIFPPPPFESWLQTARWILFAVFAGRGVATYVPSVFRYAEGTPFSRLNRRAYGPLCLAIALGICAIQL
ncbi:MULTISPECIES: DUF3995 domain-containing protein [unclassified Caulobacter]|uniref:DUF3995 domain-containing protein n=1 Tax=unclassified Caulobacter TaxID=2648921 RepID=UPI0007005D02|nr:MULTISPECIES: DUF3995 domain-containing protein [unclassified Caulobacter]KQV55322.1 hypothetical protein ASC62_22115 [Caulobacter sp. Root342]KQV63488.1 hypothetical protein ASC70_20530 [Caulobacter sp. Root343]